MIDSTRSRIVFMHDHRFLRDSSGRIYSEGKITNSVLARYHELADEIVIVSRLRDVSSIDGLIELDTGDVRMAPVKGLSIGRILGLHLLGNIRLIWREFASARTVVVRVPSFLSLLALPTLLLQRKVYFVEVVGLPNEAVRGHGSGIIYKFIGNIMLRATRWIVRKASGAVYVTQSALQSEFPNGGLTAAASNVELPMAPLISGTRNYEARNMPMKIGLIGSFSTSYKGIDLAIRGIAALHTQGVACALHILGSGDDAPYRKLADDLGCARAVRFDGIRRGGLEVAEWLDGMDIYIQPSRTEGLPRALVEAMARGLPAVGSDLGGIPELLPARWLFQPGDVSALTDRVEILLASQEERQTAGEANLLRARDYDRDVLRERRQNFWKEAAKLLAPSVRKASRLGRGGVNG